MDFVGRPLLCSEPAINILDNNVCINSLPNGCLWNGANEQNAQSAVKAHDASLLHRLSAAVYHAIVLWRVRLFVKLELGLHVLRGICDANFNSAREAACQNVLPHIFRLKFNFYRKRTNFS